MAYTLASIRNRVLEDKLDDTAYTPAVVNRFINDTQRSIAHTYELPYIEKVFIGTLDAGEYIFNFPADYEVAQSMVITAPTNFRKDLSRLYVPFREFNANHFTPGTNAGQAPSQWTTYGNKLYFSHPTDVQYTLTMFYIKSVAELTDDAHVPELPQSFEEILVLGTYYRVLQRNEDYDLAAAVKAEYLDELDKLVTRLGTRQIGTPSLIKQPLRVGSNRSSRRV